MLFIIYILGILTGITVFVAVWLIEEKKMGSKGVLTIIKQGVDKLDGEKKLAEIVSERDEKEATVDSMLKEYADIREVEREREDDYENDV